MDGAGGDPRARGAFVTNSVGMENPTGLCRLTILADRVQVDLALPVGIPLALLIPELVSMIETHHDADPLPTCSAVGTGWTLGRVGRAPLDPAGTLTSHGVHDGDLLVLQVPQHRPPPPLFDDLMHNVAAIGVDTYRRWTPTAARIAGSVAAVCLVAIGTAALLLARGHGESPVAVVAALLVASVLAAASMITARVYRDGSTAVVLSTCALPPAFAAGALAVPGPIGAPSLLLGAAVCGAIAVLSTRISGVGVVAGTAATALSASAAGAAMLAVTTDLTVPAIGAVTTAAALALLAAAPRCAMLLTRLPLPRVPSPGTHLDEEESDPAAPDASSFVGLQAKAERTRRHLTGLVAAAGTTAAVSAALASGLWGTEFTWPGMGLASATVAVLTLRGRTYASLAPAAALIGSGIATLLVLVAAAAVSTPDHAVTVFAVTAGGVGIAMTFGVVAPAREFSPVQRRAVELIDYAAIAAVIPLVCWVSGLFAAMRGL